MNRMTANRAIRGSSLVEVLVTMIIIALGLLGQASLMAVSSKANNAAFLRSQATLLSYDILERMRLNRALAVAGNFTSAASVQSSDITGDDIDKQELRDWKARVEQALPSGEASITVDADGNASIEIQWSEIAKGSESDDGSIDPTTFKTFSAI